MRAPIRTLAFYAALVGGTTLLGGCDTSVTRPADPRAAKPDALLLYTSAWSRTDLPFAPAAINGAGVIVGTNGNEAVVWQNGVLDTLQHSVVLPGPYSAIDITPNGAILGSANGHAIFWRSATSVPNDASAGFQPYLYPMAMNDSYTIVAWAFYDVGTTTYRWTPTGGWVDIGAGVGIYGGDQTIATSINANGQAAGYRFLSTADSPMPVRWGTSGGPVQLSAPIDANGEPSGKAVSIDPSGNVFGFTIAGATIWHPDGSSTVVTGLPAQPALRSDMGRFVGLANNEVFTSFNGTLTWLSYPDATAPTLMDVSSCGSIIAKRATSPATGYLWRRSGITYTCDQPMVNTVSLTY